MCDVEQTHTIAMTHHPPMGAGNPKTYVLAIRETALLLGGERELAEFLDIDEWLISRWLEGLGHPPEIVYLRCTEADRVPKASRCLNASRLESRSIRRPRPRS